MRLPVQDGVAKACMLPGGICASFSNSPELAARDFREFATQFPEGAGFAPTKTFFEKASANSGNDYLIAFARQPKLLKIADGRSIPSLANTQWIGDQIAYERFREYEKKERKGYEAGRAVNAVLFADEIEKSPASDLYSAMRHVIADPDISSVGGFAYVLSDRLEAFRQSVYCDMLFNWPELASEDYILQLSDQIDLGASGENSGFAVVQASPSYLNLNVAVFYILSAKKLFVFYGRDDISPMKGSALSDVEPLEIKSRLDGHFGREFGWLVVVMSAAPDATESTTRQVPISSGPNGVGVRTFCHANTFPSTNPSSVVPVQTPEPQNTEDLAPT